MSQLAASPSRRPAKPVSLLSSRQLGLQWLERSACVLLFFAIWELLPRAGLVNSAFLSPPSAVLAAIVQLAQTGQLGKHMAASLQRSLAGLILAVVAGVALGLLMGVVRRFEAFVDPLLQLFRQVSALALFPVFLLFFGIGEASKIAIIFWAAFWPVLLNTISGVKQVEKLLIHSALSMGASRGFIFFKVILPAAAPSIFTGIRLAGAYSITALVAAEMIGSHAGLGFLTLNSQEIFQIPSMYAGIVLLAVLGLALNYGLALLEKRLTRWRSGLEFHE
ncbi:ABC transporter permease [Comamonas testosteroni]|jgi:NitT/TauT family transport system permease protein|uniref:Binding-protein-dependent transport systems inner membrane component n=1 Tax=Comamonas testosteroni (strain DSM 14576 / KF-1) TaxID=399795 RepID=B7X3C9_COMTK|nr:MULTISPECIES: ABC transporter permease [Comamonas]EED70358.1 binding-protein-dependent transport systems inner membrane component [Comamonas testosteroni KF-1]TYK71226.1 ABC transporter permease [Comamonas sp. Z3]WQG68283.1 ABC transporter permease [Comamonas testosteroni]